MIYRRSLWRAVAGLVLVLGCSQNYSEKETAAALSEKGLRSLKPGGRESKAPASGERQSLGGISVVVPRGWQARTPSNSMRAAEYLLPGEQAGSADAELAVFYFGPGQGGSVEANLERWYGQFKQPDGSPTRRRARRWEREVGPMHVTLVDIGGTYTAGMGPGAGGESLDQYRMLGAIVDSPAGFYYVKLVGPQQTVSFWERSFSQFIDSLGPG